jgi:ribosomal protein L15
LEEFPEGSVVNRELLVSAGLIRANTKRIKILARGKLSKKLIVVADAFSDAAKGAIESVGGSASTVAA